MTNLYWGEWVSALCSGLFGDLLDASWLDARPLRGRFTSVPCFPFVDNGSLCGLVESHSFRHGFITLSTLTGLDSFVSESLRMLAWCLALEDLLVCDTPQLIYLNNKHFRLESAFCVDLCCCCVIFKCDDLKHLSVTLSHHCMLCYFIFYIFLSFSGAIMIGHLDQNCQGRFPPSPALIPQSFLWAASLRPWRLRLILHSGPHTAHCMPDQWNSPYCVKKWHI